MIRVLIVDDDRLARTGMRSLLPWEKYGMQVVGEAANGQKALEFLRDHTVDLLFVDLQMPVMSGMELIDILNRERKDLKFVVFSVQEDFKQVRQAFRMGALDYISKIKLDTEDCDQVFSGIAAAMVKSAGTAPGISPGSELPPWIAELSQKSWLFDNLLCEKLFCMIRRFPEGVNQAEHTLLKLAVRAEQEIGFEFDPSPIVSAEDLVRQMDAFRLGLYQEAEKGAGDTIFKMALRAVMYIQRHYPEPIYETDVANHVNLSRSYFSISIKKTTGFTFIELLSRERVRHSLPLLAEERLSIPEIALQIGYEDPGHFTQIFSRIMGTKPRSWQADSTIP